MRQESLKQVPTAILSRQTAAHRGAVLVINLPGKPASIETCLNAVFPAVPYCLDLIGAATLETDAAILKSFPAQTTIDKQEEMSRSASNRAKEDSDAAVRVAKLTAGYMPLPGIPDEFIGADGRPRAHWLRFLDKLMEFPADDMSHRFARADRHLATRASPIAPMGIRASVPGRFRMCRCSSKPANGERYARHRAARAALGTGFG